MANRFRCGLPALPCLQNRFDHSAAAFLSATQSVSPFSRTQENIAISQQVRKSRCQPLMAVPCKYVDFWSCSHSATGVRPLHMSRLHRGALVHTEADRISGPASISGGIFLAVETKKTGPVFFFFFISLWYSTFSHQLTFSSGKKATDFFFFLIVFSHRVCRPLLA